MANRKLSPLMILVLEECQRAASDEATPTSQIVDRLMAENGSSLGVAKASVSRTLRRIWRRGLVELYDLDRDGELQSLSEIKAIGLERLQAAEKDPARHLGIVRERSSGSVPWKTPAALLKDYRRFFGGEFPKGFKVRYVSVVPRASN